MSESTRDSAQPAPVREGVVDEDDAEIDRILAMSADEIRAELVAEGHDPDELVRKERLGLDGLLRLAADRNRWRTEAGSWRRVAERLEAEKQSLREALKPFAAILAKGEPVGPIPRGLLDRSVTRQDLRRATEALAAPPVPEPVAPDRGDGTRADGDGWQAGAEAMRAAAAAHLRKVADGMEASCRGDLGTMFAAQSASDIRQQAKRVAELDVPPPPAAWDHEGGGR